MTRPGPGVGLPATARARIAAIKASGTWDSALSTGEFAAIRAVGFEPVGQVFGAAVYRVGFPGGSVCPTYGRERPLGVSALQADVLSTGRDVFGPLVNAAYEARRVAIKRMVAECSTLDGHGIVGLALTADHLHGGVLECTALGTAIRAPGTGRVLGGRPLQVPFTAVATGQEFAKLIMAGSVPVRVVFGISIGVSHDDWLARRLNRALARKLAGNVEISSYTDLVNSTRRAARNELKRHAVGVGGRGVLIQRTDLRIGEYECPGLKGDRDFWAEAAMTGTAIVEIAANRDERRPDRRPERHDQRAESRESLPVVSLDPERRQAARVRLG